MAESFNMKYVLNEKHSLKNPLISSMQVSWNKDKNLDKAVWVNQIALFLQPLFCDWTTGASDKQHQIVPISPIL